EVAPEDQRDAHRLVRVGEEPFGVGAAVQEHRARPLHHPAAPGGPPPPLRGAGTLRRRLVLSCPVERSETGEGERRAPARWWRGRLSHTADILSRRAGSPTRRRP